MFKHILLPLDGSTLAEAAIPYAVEFCKQFDARITLLHVIEKDAPPEIHGQRHLTTEVESNDYLAKIAEQDFGFCKSINRHVHAEEVAHVSSSIVDHSDELKPDLIILTAHGEGGLRDIVVGSIAQQVIAAGSVAVLLIQTDKIDKKKSSRIRNILIPLDGELDHEYSLEVAANIAKKLDSRLQMIRVIPTYSTLTGEYAAVGTLLPATTSAYLDIAEEEACEFLQEKLEFLRKKGVDVGAETQRGDITQEVIDAADRLNCDLIVLGTHGKAGLSAFWAGSVAPKIVAKARLPILLVPVRRE